MYYIIKIAVWIAFHVYFSLGFEGRDNIPRGEAVIYASNHRSNADPPLSAAELSASTPSWRRRSSSATSSLRG